MSRRNRTVTDPRIADGQHRARALQLALRLLVLVLLTVALTAAAVTFRALAAREGLR